MKLSLALSLGISLATLAGGGCTQPRIDCTTGHGGFAVLYTPKPGTKQGTGACDAKKGEIVGLEKYNPSSAADKDKQDLTKATLALRSATIGQLAVDNGITDPTQVDSVGDFVSTEPDAKDVCTVPKLNAAEIVLSATDKDGPADIKYEWSNVRVYVTTAYEGTEMVADLTYTEDGCSVGFSVLGLWPAIDCGMPDPAATMDHPGLLPDQDACSPVAKGSHMTGSGINPDFADNITCQRVRDPNPDPQAKDPGQFLCVLKSIPAPLK